MNQPILSPPSDTWLKPRVEGGIYTPAHREIYQHALECMRQAIQSPYDRLVQDRYTGGWLNCEGQELYRGDYPSLFAVIGTTYGAGNGTTTFNLPNLAGRVVVGRGTGSGLTARSMGATGGAETHTLTSGEIPSHSHDVSNTVQKSGFNTPSGLDNGGSEIDNVTTVSTTSTSAGGGGSHNNMQPFAVLNYIIKY